MKKLIIICILILACFSSRAQFHHHLSFSVNYYHFSYPHVFWNYPEFMPNYAINDFYWNYYSDFYFFEPWYFSSSYFYYPTYYPNYFFSIYNPVWSYSYYFPNYYYNNRYSNFRRSFRGSDIVITKKTNKSLENDDMYPNRNRRSQDFRLEPKDTNPNLNRYQRQFIEPAPSRKTIFNSERNNYPQRNNRNTYMNRPVYNQPNNSIPNRSRSSSSYSQQRNRK